MLEYLRNAADKPVAKILIGILAFSFIGWGVAEWIFGGAVRDTTLVRVGDTEISVQQFSAERSHELASMSRDEMRAIYADPAAGTKFNNDIITHLATRTMAQNRAADLGFIVTDGRVAHEIREMPEFQVGGKFSTFAFDSVLNASGYSEAEFAAVVRNQILRQMVLGIIGAPIKVPQFAVTAAYNARYATRDIEYATVKFADFDAGTPTDDQLREFYAQNPQIVPETRTVSYVLVPADMDKPDLADAAYKTAIKIEDDIISGDPMKDVAARHGAKFTSLKPFDVKNAPTDAVLDDALVLRAFDMAAGTESELIETKKGFVIMRVDNVVPAHNADFDSVKAGLVADWKKEAQRKQAYIAANDILVDVNAGQDMRKGKSANVSRTSGAPVAVLAAAFNSPVGTNAIVPAEDAFYVMTVRNVNAPATDAQKMANVNKEAQELITRELADDYNAFLNREYPVKLNEKVYRRFIQQ